MTIFRLRQLVPSALLSVALAATAADQLPPLPVPNLASPTPQPNPPAAQVVAPAPAPAQTAGIPASPQPAFTNEVIVFDSLLKEASGKLGDASVAFTFYLTNVASSEVLINNVRTSCGCTVASLPSRPWRLLPGTNGNFGVTVDVRGKLGTLTKSVYVDAVMASNNAAIQAKPLTVRVLMPDRPPIAGDPMGDRQRNMQLALADRQAVFKGDCAKCHFEPALGKKSDALYAAACASCHDSPNRASMVPDLHALKHPTDNDYWRKWITSGKTGTLMPAFAKAEGGPLTDEQISSLVDYLVKSFPSKSAAAQQSNKQVAGGIGFPAPQTK
jgi:cytochrome c553